MKKIIIKRLFDFVCALSLLMLVLPIFLGVSVFILIKMGKPIFYRGRRVGLQGAIFEMYKFRTMTQNAEKMGGPSTALNDPRLTSLGKFLRKYKLDELPQLMNILKGDMSFVGPRPQVEKYTSLYTAEEKKILSVRPGITDYASIKLIHLDHILGDVNVDEKYLNEVEPLKNRLRLKYVYEQSFLTDIKILFLTLVQLFKINKLWNTEN
ncbi:MAG: sugar transferase [Gammaproteobacteria bacterium]|nr:sugar transferase [Gammaproteobacteria bacterium]